MHYIVGTDAGHRYLLDFVFTPSTPAVYLAPKSLWNLPVRRLAANAERVLLARMTGE